MCGSSLECSISGWGSYALAKSYLESAIKGKEVPTKVRERVGVFLAKINDLLSTSKVFGSVSAGLRYQTNANAGPSSSSVLLFDFPPNSMTPLRARRT